MDKEFFDKALQIAKDKNDALALQLEAKDKEIKELTDTLVKYHRSLTIKSKEIEDLTSSWEYEKQRAEGAVNELIEVHLKLDVNESENTLLEAELKYWKKQAEFWENQANWENQNKPD